MTNCAICGHTINRVILAIHEPDRFEKSVGVQSTGYTRKWIACDGCGALTNKLPSESKDKIDQLRGSYYEVDFMGKDISKKYDFVMNLPVELSDNAARSSRVYQFAKNWFLSDEFNNLRVLDIGAGTGVFLSKLAELSSQYTWKIQGVEPDPNAAEHLRRLAKFDVFEGMFAGQLKYAETNLVTLNKVIEHIEDPIELLGCIKKIICKTASLLYIEVPDAITAQIANPADNILGALHCHLYDFGALTYMAQELNLKILKMERIREPSGKFTIFAFLTWPENLTAKWGRNDI